jgi:hypothetical protein
MFVLWTPEEERRALGNLGKRNLLELKNGASFSVERAQP